MPVICKMSREVSWDQVLTLLEQKEPLSEELLLMGYVLAREYKNIEINAWSEIAMRFLQKLDSWHYVDCVVSGMKWITQKRMKQKHSELEKFLLDGLYAEEEFLCRFCIVMLFKYYPQLTEELLGRFLDFDQNSPYYVKKAIAWGMSEIYFRDSQRILEFLPRLECEIKKMSIQKICQSKRTAQNQKEFLRSL